MERYFITNNIESAVFHRNKEMIMGAQKYAYDGLKHRWTNVHLTVSDDSSSMNCPDFNMKYQEKALIRVICYVEM